MLCIWFFWYHQAGEGEIKMPDHKKKMIAPVVITVLFLLFLLVYVIMIAAAMIAVPLMFLLAIPLIALGAGMIVVLRDRLNEIIGGEEDDLSNY